MENDLISRSAVIDRIAEFLGPKGLDEWEVMVAIREIIENVPTIDAVPVVRCRDCIHAVAITNLTIANRCGLGQKNCMRQRGDDGFGFAGVSVVYPDGFCDEGARMDGESEEDTNGHQTD